MAASARGRHRDGTDWPRWRAATAARRSWPRRRGSAPSSGSTRERGARRGPDGGRGRRGGAAAGPRAAARSPEVLEARRARRGRRRARGCWSPRSCPAPGSTCCLPDLAGRARADGRAPAGRCSSPAGADADAASAACSSTATCVSSRSRAATWRVRARRPARDGAGDLAGSRVRRPARGGRRRAGPARRGRAGPAWCTATSTRRTCWSTRRTCRGHRRAGLGVRARRAAGHRPGQPAALRARRGVRRRGAGRPTPTRCRTPGGRRWTWPGPRTCSPWSTSRRRRGENPVAERAHDLLRAVARAGTCTPYPEPVQAQAGWTRGVCRRVSWRVRRSLPESQT